MISAALAVVTASPTPASAQPDNTGETPETLILQDRMFKLIDRGRYSQALPLAERRLALLEKRLGPDALKLANVLSVAGYYRRMIGDYRHAEPLYQRALAIVERSGGQTPEAVYAQRTFGASRDVDFADALRNLGDLYREEGDYARAESFYQRLLSFWEAFDRSQGAPEGSSTPDTLDRLGELGREKKSYPSAEAFFSRALAAREKRKAGDLAVAASLRNLGSLYRVSGDGPRAEPLLLRALSLTEQALGPLDRRVAPIALELGKLYGSAQSYGRAEPLLQRALSVREHDLGPSHPDVAAILSDWAEICVANRELACADKHAQRALAIVEKTLGPSHGRVADCLFTLSDARAAQGDLGEAVRLSERAAAIQDRSTADLLAVGSELQRRAHLDAQEERTFALVSLHAASAPTDPAAARLALTTILRRKGRVLDAMADSFSILRSHQDPAGQALFDDLARVSSELSAQTSRGPGSIALEEHRANMAELLAERRRIEAAIGSRSAECRADQQPVSLSQVKAALPAGAALLELFAYRPRRLEAPPAERWGAPRYLAYVLRPNGDVASADLGEVGPIDEAVKSLRRALADPDLTHFPTRAASDLDARVMRPVRPLLGDAHQVFLSPDGALHLVPFAALIGEDGRALIERYTFTYLTSGRELLRFTASAPPRQDRAVLLADPTFGDLRAPEAPSAPGPAPDQRRGLLSADMDQVKFMPLPGTGAEATAIARMIPGARLLLGPAATEGALRALHGPGILHIATDGFFLPSNDPPAARAQDNPLLRAGLALAGANLRSSGEDDGILTALEASALDLYGTRLVVLSACETGLGEATNGDGVYGLRRALVIAGAETQVLSLWKVKDAPTQALMKSYYARLLRGEGRSEALRQAALEMLSQKETANPNLWASFIVSGSGAALDGGPAPPPPLRARGCGCELAAEDNGSKGAAAVALIGLIAAARRRRARPIGSCYDSIRCDKWIALTDRGKPCVEPCLSDCSRSSL